MGQIIIYRIDDVRFLVIKLIYQNIQIYEHNCINFEYKSNIYEGSKFILNEKEVFIQVQVQY